MKTPFFIPEHFASLSPREAFWRGKQAFLQSRGYMLRPRYHPGWTPSWNLEEPVNILPEDAIMYPVCTDFIWFDF